MPLYKVTHSVVTYFVSSKKGQPLLLEAEDRAKAFVAIDGFDRLERPVLVKAGEEIEGTWEASFEVPGDPNNTTLGELMDDLVAGSEDDDEEKPEKPVTRVAMSDFAREQLESIQKAASPKQLDSPERSKLKAAAIEALKKRGTST